MLRERNKHYGTIKFVDISSDDYSPIWIGVPLRDLGIEGRDRENWKRERKKKKHKLCRERKKDIDLERETQKKKKKKKKSRRVSGFEGL